MIELKKLYYYVLRLYNEIASEMNLATGRNLNCLQIKNLVNNIKKKPKKVSMG